MSKICTKTNPHIITSISFSDRFYHRFQNLLVNNLNTFCAKLFEPRKNIRLKALENTAMLPTAIYRASIRF